MITFYCGGTNAIQKYTKVHNNMTVHNEVMKMTDQKGYYFNGTLATNLDQRPSSVQLPLSAA
jgi:hypothetical protein